MLLLLFSYKSCMTLCYPMDCSPPGSSIHGISLARVLELVAISSFMGSSWPKDRTCVSCIGRWILYHWPTREAQKYVMRNRRSNCQHPLDHRKSKRVPEKHLLLLYWLCQSLWLCESQQTMGNSSRDGNTTPPDLPPEKYVCRSRSNSYNWTWNNRLGPNRESSTSRLYIVTLLI